MSLWIRASPGAVYANGANLHNLVTQMPPLCWQTGRDLGYMWMPVDVSALGCGTERRHIWGSWGSCQVGFSLCEDPSPAPRSRVSPRHPSAARGELPSRGDAPQDARFTSKSLCPSPVPVTPACCRSSGLVPVPCPFPVYAMFFALLAGTSEAISKSLRDPAACPPVAHLPLADGLRLGQGWGDCRSTSGSGLAYFLVSGLWQSFRITNIAGWAPAGGSLCCAGARGPF